MKPGETHRIKTGPYAGRTVTILRHLKSNYAWFVDDNGERLMVYDGEFEVEKKEPDKKSKRKKK